MDIAFHTSSSSAGLQCAVDAVGFEGKIIELSWYGMKATQIELGGSFHHQRKQIISSQVGHLPSDKIARWNYYRRKELVFQLLQNEIFDQHISHSINFENSPEFFNQLRKGQLPTGIGWCIDYHNFEKPKII